MLLTLMIFVPLIGMIVVLCLPRNAEETIKRATLVFTLIPLILGVILLAGYDRASEDSQYAVKMMWIEAFKIHYHIGIDGLSVTLILLTVLLGPICVIASWRNIEKGIKAYMALFLLLETGMIGFFAALDLFLFYVFFELTLLPMYFLIGIWGGPRREYAAIKFFLYTLFGSVLMLIAMIAVYLKGGTFDIPTLITYAQQTGHASQQPGISDLGLPRFLYRIRRQSPDFPLPHVASRRARRSADSHQCYSCGYPTEDGNVRTYSSQLRHAAGRDGFLHGPKLRKGAGAICHLGLRVGHPRIYQYRLRIVLRAGANRLQETRRLLQYRAHGVRHTGACGA